MRQLHRLEIKSLDQLAAQIGIAGERLEVLCHGVGSCYHKFERISRSGKIRSFRVPNAQLMDVQDRINKRILRRLTLPPELHGSREGHSIKTLAAVHTGQKTVLRLDLKEFFPSIRPKRVYDFFVDQGCGPTVARMLTQLTTYDFQLPQGAPTSPSIANHIIVASGLYGRLRELAKVHRLRPGFYVDDIFLSGDIEPRRLKKLLVRIISDAGLRVSEEKLDLHYARRSHERQEGPGTVLNRKVNVPKAYVRQVRSTLYRCRTKGIAGQVPNDKTADAFRLTLMGKIQHVRWINPTVGDKLLAEFRRIDWESIPRAGRS